MAENKNWLAQKGNDINDNEFSEYVSEAEVAEGNFNRVMLDKVHAENVAGYISQGFSEYDAKKMADKRRSEAISAAKANGLSM
jgi:hypothetical protein